MAVHNASIAEILRRVANLLEIEGANPFRIRAYRRAALTIEDLPQSAAKMVAEGKTLVGLPGIGKDLAEKITEIIKTGHPKALVRPHGGTNAGRKGSPNSAISRASARPSPRRSRISLQSRIM